MIEIKSKIDCTACSACVEICPKNCIIMQSDSEGFLYPYVKKENCVTCELCVKHCHILNKTHIDKKYSIAYGCYNQDNRIRLNSSSGGVFSLLAEEIINRDGIVYGASLGNDLVVEHIYVDKIEDIHKLRGSKYVQSKIENVYSDIKKFLESGRLIYFSGTPCQVDGLLSFLSKKYENLITQDIICHGVPSPSVWKRYVDEKNISYKSVISFRDKINGWKDFSFKSTDGFVINESHKKNDYLQSFLKNYTLRPSCYECKSKSIERNSDITLGDFWGVENIVSTFDDDKGISLVLINSQNGLNLFDKVKNKLTLVEVDREEALKYNSAAYQSVPKPKQRSKFFKLIYKNSFANVMKKCNKESIFLKIKKYMYHLISS